MSRGTILILVLGMAITAIAQTTKAGTTKTGIAYDVVGRRPTVVLITGSNLRSQNVGEDQELVIRQSHRDSL